MNYYTLDKLKEYENKSEYYSVGDIVIPRFANYEMTGKVVDVDVKLDRVCVDWNGEVIQMEPMDISLSQTQRVLDKTATKRVARRMKSRKSNFALRVANAIADGKNGDAFYMLKPIYPQLTSIQVSRIVEKLSKS